MAARRASSGTVSSAAIAWASATVASSIAGASSRAIARSEMLRRAQDACSVQIHTASSATFSKRPYRAPVLLRPAARATWLMPSPS